MKAAANSRRKLAPRLAKRKRMAMVAAAYALERWPRGPEDIIRDEEKRGRP
jgi:hypothetical protein